MIFNIEVLAGIIFACAVIHTFSVSFFARLAHRGGAHAGVWHWFSEVEAVFGIWATVLIVVMAFGVGTSEAIHYVEQRNFTEPLFVFAIMVIAASQPILLLVKQVVTLLARVIPGHQSVITYMVLMFLVPISGSLITEPAAMTVAALMVREMFFQHTLNNTFKYASLGLLFVNVSIGGVLTSYAAPPVLMVAETFGWDTLFMLQNFGWKAALAIALNVLIVAVVFRKTLYQIQYTGHKDTIQSNTLVTAIHVMAIALVVLNSHHPAVFLGIFLLFLGFVSAYPKYQSPLMIKSALLVGFFLAGLVLLGGLQKWWLQPAIEHLNPLALFFGATALTAITDNAALTYLGAQVEGVSDAWRYMLVAGAVTGGGLTVIANAPNPAGYAILKDSFNTGSISPGGLFLAALGPTVVAAFCFLL